MARAVFFDVDGVLVHGYHANPDRSVRWDENLLDDLGIDPAHFRQKFIFGPFVNEVIVGKKPMVTALSEVLPGLGFHDSPMVVLDYWLRHDSYLNRQLLDAIRDLLGAPDIRLYIATNQDHARAQWLWQTLGMSETFEDIFYAARMGVLKPEPAFFDGIMKIIGPQDEPPLFFDDSPKVVDGARAYGWEAILYDNLEDVTEHPFIKARLGM